MACLVIAIYNCSQQLTESCLYFFLSKSAQWELLQAGANASRSSHFIHIRTQIIAQNSLSKLKSRNLLTFEVMAEQKIIFVSIFCNETEVPEWLIWIGIGNSFQ